MMLPGMGFTSASWSAYSTMNGVMSPSVSAGSSQRETSVTWRPMTMVPGSGAAIAGVPTAPATSIRKRTAAAQTCDSKVIECLPVGSPCWSRMRRPILHPGEGRARQTAAGTTVTGQTRPRSDGQRTLAGHRFARRMKVHPASQRSLRRGRRARRGAGRGPGAAGAGREASAAKVTASECCANVRIDATTTRASTSIRVMPATETRSQASITMPRSSTRSSTSVRLAWGATRFALMSPRAASAVPVARRAPSPSGAWRGRQA